MTGKTRENIGLQYGKYIIDTVLQKPPKHQNSFRAVASAVRKSAVGLHRMFAM